MQRYPRDLRGYGPNLPRANWPSDAKLALQFVLNYEEGGENNTLHGDPASEAFLSEIIGAQPWRGQRHANMESMYEYGARAGFWRLYRMFTGMKVPVTVYGVATALARSPEQVMAMKAANWEIASHGLKWVEHKDMTEDEERRVIRKAIDLHSEVCGAPPQGWYTGRSSESTLRLLAEENRFEYLADSYADELPYWSRFGRRDQLIVPYTLDANDMRFATAQGFNTGEQFFSYLRDTFDTLYAEGEAGAPKMMSVGLHCRLAGRPGRFKALQAFMQHVMKHKGVWIARRIDIARHWTKQHPPTRPKLALSEMDKATFVAAFGGIFEHSPWVAERAFEYEIGPAHDCSAGAHNLLCRAFRSATEEERRGVLFAHPDLAGKLAAEKKLTPSSAAEQAAAGLNDLAAQERQTFAELNEHYRQTFGYPFIVAARDHDKAGILVNLDERLDNDLDTEFALACAQVERIAWFRLEDMFKV